MTRRKVQPGWHVITISQKGNAVVMMCSCFTLINKILYRGQNWYMQS